MGTPQSDWSHREGIPHPAAGQPTHGVGNGTVVEIACHNHWVRTRLHRLTQRVRLQGPALVRMHEHGPQALAFLFRGTLFHGHVVFFAEVQALQVDVEDADWTVGRLYVHFHDTPLARAIVKHPRVAPQHRQRRGHCWPCAVGPCHQSVALLAERKLHIGKHGLAVGRKLLKAPHDFVPFLQPLGQFCPGWLAFKPFELVQTTNVEGQQPPAFRLGLHHESVPNREHAVERWPSHRQGCGRNHHLHPTERDQAPRESHGHHHPAQCMRQPKWGQPGKPFRRNP